jgi:hypothetical protein
VFKGRLSKHSKLLQDRLSKFVSDAREKLDSLPAGHERDKLRRLSRLRPRQRSTHGPTHPDCSRQRSEPHGWTMVIHR